MRDKYLVSDAKFEEVLDVRRTYKPGEISETTGLQKQPDGSWAEPKKNKQVSGTFPAGDRINIKPSKRDPSTIKRATPSQKESLETVSDSVEVSKIDTNAIKIVDDTVKSMISEYNLRPLKFITTYNELGGPMGESDGNGIFLNEDFYNDPSRYIDYMLNKQNYAIQKYKEGKTFKPIKGMEEVFAENLNDMKHLTTRGNALYKGREIECVTLHEMAHVLFRQRFEELTGIEKLVLDNELTQMFVDAQISRDIDSVSLYANKSYEEYFTEAFVIYKMGIDKLPDSVIKMLKKVIR